MALDAALQPLALDDIIHTLSPSPGPEVVPEYHEPLTDADINRMRRRVEEMGFLGPPGMNPSPRELELADMVLRLTESTLLDSSQLLRQAETIAGLSAQRDFLVVQTEEERERWESEKDGWARMAEALISQRHRIGSNGVRDADLERQYAAFESDNRSLRDKLHETQTRLQSLESELTKLRPILLMQPFPNSAQPTPSVAHASAFLSSIPYPSLDQPHSSKPKPKKKKEPRVPVHSIPLEESDVAGRSEEKAQLVAGNEPSLGSFSQFQAQPPPGPSTHPVVFSGDHYRKPVARTIGGPLAVPPTTIQFQVDPPMQQPTTPGPQLTLLGPPPITTNPFPTISTLKTTPKFKRSRAGGIAPLTSDARSEHLLLAARKIGRERAGIIAGLIRDRHHDVDPQKAQRAERERERLERERRERMGGRDRGSYYRRESMIGTSPATPKTVVKPRNGASGSYYPNIPAPLQAQSPLGKGAGLNAPIVLVDANRGTITRPQPSGSGNSQSQPNTPRTATAGSSGQQVQGQQVQGGPSTPLASLLDAARMMDDDTGTTQGEADDHETTTAGGDTGKKGRARNSSSLEQQESPAPKRRRVGGRGGSGASDASEKIEDAHGRVRSALDVLADQAAAFSSADRGNGKGKGKEVVGRGARPVDDVNGTPKTRGRRAKDRAKEKQQKAEPLPPSPVGGRKTRAKAPPKPRKIAPASAATPALKVKGKEKEKAGSAVPRMISPPGPRTFGLVSTIASTTSDVDIDHSTSLTKPEGTIHTPPKHTSGPGKGPESAKFGFHPVAWGNYLDLDDSEVSSPIRPVASAPKESENQGIDEERTGMDIDLEPKIEDSVIVTHRSSRRGGGIDTPPPKNNVTAIAADEPALGPAALASLPPEETNSREPLLGASGYDVESDGPAMKPPDGEDAEMDNVEEKQLEIDQHSEQLRDGQSFDRVPVAQAASAGQITLQTDVLHHPSIVPLLDVPLELLVTPGSEQDTMTPNSNTIQRAPHETPEEPGQKQTLDSDLIMGTEDRQIILGEVDEKNSGPPTLADHVSPPSCEISARSPFTERSTLDPLDPNSDRAPQASMDVNVDADIDAEADADIDLDLDADGEVDAEGEADAEGDVDAEGEVDPDVDVPTNNHSHDDLGDAQDESSDIKHGRLSNNATHNNSSLLSLQEQSGALGESISGTSDSSEQSSRLSLKLTSRDLLAMVPDRRPRSPYVKWTREEDDLLAEAVGKHGQKWDLVQKALPNRGYHQVRQRWLRKLGLFDNKPDLTASQAGGSSAQAPAMIGGIEMPQIHPPPNPKLGFAPLSSELAYLDPGHPSR